MLGPPLTRAHQKEQEIHLNPHVQYRRQYTKSSFGSTGMMVEVSMIDSFLYDDGKWNGTLSITQYCSCVVRTLKDRASTTSYMSHGQNSLDEA